MASARARNRADEVPLVGEEPPSLPWHIEDDEEMRRTNLKESRKDMGAANKDRKKRGKRPYNNLLEFWGRNLSGTYEGPYGPLPDHSI